MTDPRSSLLTFPLTLGMDNVSHPEAVQPFGQRPRLVASVNTRLSKVPGLASKAPGSTALLAYSGLTVGGAIPAGQSDSTLVQSGAPRRVTGSVATELASVLSASDVQSAYYPAQVERAGIVPGSNTSRYNASCAYDAANEWTYFVTIRPIGTGAGAYLNVLAADGREIVNSYLLATLALYFSDETSIAAVSVHGSTVLFWYEEFNNLVARTITVSPTTHAVTLGTPANITTTFSGISGPNSFQLAYDDLDTANVYVAINSSVGANRFDVLRVTVATLVVAATFTSAVIGFNRLAIAYRSGVGLICAANIVAGKINEYELDPTTLVQTWTQAGVMETGWPACGFETRVGVQYRVFAVSRIEVGFDGTLVEWRTSAGGLAYDGAIKHQTMIGQVVTMRSAHSADEMCCLFTTLPCYAPDDPQASYDVDSDFFVPDPSVDVFRVIPNVTALGPSTLVAYSVARLGTDLVIRYPGSLNPFDFGGVNPNLQFVGNPLSCIAIGNGRALVTYLQENIVEGDVALGYSVRYAQLDFRALQPRFAHTSDGATIVAGALPAVWDGSLLTEFSPLRQPVITAETTGGTGAAFPAGTYLVAALITWVDAHGQLHRSAPSNVVTLTDAAPFTPTVTVNLPESYRNFLTQPGLQVVLYVSEAGGITPYANPSWLEFAASTVQDTAAILISDIDPPVVDGFHPAIYTDGSETQALSAYCPNASLDVAVIADRVWMLDAERPSRWWFSKPKESGIFQEMSPDCFIDTPSNAGRGVALSHWNGNPVFLTDRGVWTLAGEGPDALNNPPFFSSAVQVSDVACTQRLSVVRSPAGVMFVSNNRFVRFTGQMAEYPEINATLHGDVVGVAVFRKQQEVAWFLEDGYAYVYNWVADAFTLWDTNVTGVSALTGCAQRVDEKVVLISATAIRLLDPETVATSATLYVETGHVQLGDKQDNNNLENIVLHARYGGTHGLIVAIRADYGSAQLNQKTRTTTQIANCINTLNVYDVAMEPAQQAARAVALIISEADATGEGFQPISLSMEVLKKPGKAVRNLPDAARV